jgi:hypothetical protein
VEKLSLLPKIPSSTVLNDLARRWSPSAESMTKDPTRAISELRVRLWFTYSKINRSLKIKKAHAKLDQRVLFRDSTSEENPLTSRSLA